MRAFLENSDRGVHLRVRVLLTFAWLAVGSMVLTMIGRMSVLFVPMTFWLDNVLSGLMFTGSVAVAGALVASLVGLWASRHPRVAAGDEVNEG